MTLTPGGVLATVTRGGLVESLHTGHLVVLDPEGGVVLAVGDPDVTVWARSSLKPLQAVALLEAGLDLDGPEGLALACASHSGEPRHLDVVRRVLAGAGLDETALGNTPDVPLGPEAAQDWRAAGQGPTSLAQNCSGKHAAMLATCVAAGWPTAGYLDPAHPLQVAVAATLARLTGVDVAHRTVDGCGAMLPSTSLRGLARAFGRVATGAPGSAEGRVARAVAEHPELVGGTGRDVTAFLRAVPGLLAKDGAEGVYAAALADGTSVALKVADGSARPRPAVLAAALEVALADAVRRGADPVGAEVVAALRAAGSTPVLGHGRAVGEVTAAWGPADVPGTTVDASTGGTGSTGSTGGTAA